MLCPSLVVGVEDSEYSTVEQHEDWICLSLELIFGSMLLSFIHVCLCVIQSIHPSNECFCNNLIYFWCLLIGVQTTLIDFPGLLLTLSRRSQTTVFCPLSVPELSSQDNGIFDAVMTYSSTSRRPDDKRPLASATSQNLTSLFVDQSSYVSMHSYHLFTLASFTS